MVKIQTIILSVFLLLCLPFLVGGIMTFNPATEEEELIFIPNEKERNMGRKFHEQIKKRFDLSVDPLLQERVENIGKNIVVGSDRKAIVYRFTVLEDKKDGNYNAFAAPGGYIYIFVDLVEALETDDKIAAVLAHEMGHVEAKHVIKRMQGNLGVTALVLLGNTMQTDRRTRAKLGSAIGQLMSAYSRHDEQQADELSVKYLKRAKYDPNGAVQSIEKLKGLRKKAPRMKYRFFRSHPYLSERIAYLKNYINGETNFDSYINLVSDEDII